MNFRANLALRVLVLALLSLPLFAAVSALKEGSARAWKAYVTKVNPAPVIRKGTHSRARSPRPAAP